MSADNWAQCANCFKIADARSIEANDAFNLAVVNYYGKVSLEEYERLKGNAQKRMQEASADLLNVGHTFREDYEIGCHGTAEVTWNYRGSCKVCGTSVESSGSFPIPPVEPK